MTGEAPEGSCITCGDQGIEVVVIVLDPATSLARCSEPGGTLSDVETGLIDNVVVGSRLIVHAGTAIARVDAEGMPT